MEFNEAGALLKYSWILTFKSSDFSEVIKSKNGNNVLERKYRFVLHKQYKIAETVIKIYC
jgi:hypothetical protein